MEAGQLLRRLQGGESLGMPHSRPMPSIGKNCHELRVRDAAKNWRIFYHIDSDAILVLAVHNKTTQKIPGRVIEACTRTLAAYDLAVKNARKEKK